MFSTKKGAASGVTFFALLPFGEKVAPVYLQTLQGLKGRLAVVDGDSRRPIPVSLWKRLVSGEVEVLQPRVLHYVKDNGLVNSQSVRIDYNILLNAAISLSPSKTVEAARIGTLRDMLATDPRDGAQSMLKAIFGNQ